MHKKTRSEMPPDPYSDDPWSWAFVVFRYIPGWPGYGIDSNGILWGCRATKHGYSHSWQQRKTAPNRKGYLMAILSVNKVIKNFYIHRLVLETFIGSYPEGMETRHKNGDNQDNRLSNLEFGTHSQNEQDKLQHGTYYTRNTAAEIDEELAISIYNTYLNGDMSQQEVADHFGVSRTIVGRIVRGENWSFKTGHRRTNFDRIDKKGALHHNAKLTNELVIEMRKMRNQGSTYDEIEAAFQINRCSAWRICNYKGYVNVP